MEQTETLHIDRYRLTSSSYLEAVRESRFSIIDLWLCEGTTKRYLETVEAYQNAITLLCIAKITDSL